MSRVVRVYAADPDFRVGECALKFTLTYEGDLQTGGDKVVRKHVRRRLFHAQIKRLWEVNSLLKSWALPVDQNYAEPAADVLAKRFGTLQGFQFVPLISNAISVEAALHFHVLRPTTFKGETRDIDNIVKTLMDSLKKPQDSGEMPSDAYPAEGEAPFFVLLQDDSLVSKITAVGDELLQPVLGKDNIERSDTRVMIDVYIRPNFPSSTNLIFFSDDFEIWNHRWAEGVFDNIRSWSNTELKARTTQCILRMQVTAHNFRMQRTAYDEWPPRSAEHRQELHRRDREQSDERHAVWNGGLRPVAFAIMEELQRRIYGEPPYPSDQRSCMGAIEDGMLAGVDPILEAAEGLNRLIRQLP